MAIAGDFIMSATALVACWAVIFLKESLQENGSEMGVQGRVTHK